MLSQGDSTRIELNCTTPCQCPQRIGELLGVADPYISDVRCDIWRVQRVQ